ncbi:hypothetical protein RFI_07572, partial [Reticulomyxa filosa]
MTESPLEEEKCNDSISNVIVREVISSEKLFREHPPKFTNKNKQYLWEKCVKIYNKEESEATNSKRIDLVYARYAVQAHEALKAVTSPKSFIENNMSVKEDIYDYVRIEAKDTYEFYVNFADANLFGFYAGPLFAQDE